jgi:hypothetical protein
MGRTFVKTLATLTVITVAFGCSKKADSTSVATPKTLYVASGACYSGSGITTYTGPQSSRAVTKWSTETAINTGIFTDLNVGNNVSVNTVPQALIDKGDHVLLLTENATNFSDRKIFKINKANPGTYVVYANDPTAFTVTPTHITRSMAQDVDGTMIFSKSLFAERLNTLGVRIAKGGANPWVNAAAATGNCFTAAAAQIQQVALMTPFTNMNQGKLLFIHTGATAVTNRIGIVQRTGLTSGTAGDCAGSSPAGGASTVVHANAPNLTGPVAMPATGDSLTSMVYIPTPAPALTSGKLLVTYSGSVATAFDNNTTFNYGIVMWDITETSDTVATVANPVIIYRDESVLWAPSAMAYDASTSSLYVAVGGSPGSVNQTTQAFGYNIEKFTLDLATPSMTRVSPNNQPFITGNAYTKCISHMMLAD